MTQEEIDLLEQNAPEKHLRFKGADFYSPGTPVLVLGAGGIGSHLTLLLAKQGQKVTVIDHDILEPHNIGGQLHPVYRTTEGMSKVQILKDTVWGFAEEEIEAIHGKYEEGDPVYSFTFTGFDNMAARKAAFESWKLLEDPNKLFIDGRMLADQGVIYAVRPENIEAYEATLFDDSEVDEGPCTNRSNSYCAFFITALMVAAFNNHLSNLRHGVDLKSVPFETRYALSAGLINVYESPRHELTPS